MLSARIIRNSGILLAMGTPFLITYPGQVLVRTYKYEKYCSEINMNIGLALGSGSSRGWSHIGVINALADQGIVPNIICGTSIGSLVGASFISDNLEKLEEWVCALTKFKTARFFDINTSLNGFVNTEKLCLLS